MFASASEKKKTIGRRDWTVARLRKRKFKVQVEKPAGSGNLELLELEGTPLVIEGYESITFIYHKFPDAKHNRVSELKTGARVIDYCKNKAEAVQQAKMILDSNVQGSVEKLKRRMRYLKDKHLGGEYLNEDKQGSLL
jgi:hypothetical protein